MAAKVGQSGTCLHQLDAVAAGQHEVERKQSVTSPPGRCGATSFLADLVASQRRVAGSGQSAADEPQHPRPVVHTRMPGGPYRSAVGGGPAACPRRRGRGLLRPRKRVAVRRDPWAAAGPSAPDAPRRAACRLRAPKPWPKVRCPAPACLRASGGNRSARHPSAPCPKPSPRHAPPWASGDPDGRRLRSVAAAASAKRSLST